MCLWLTTNLRKVLYDPKSISGCHNMSHCPIPIPRSYDHILCVWQLVLIYNWLQHPAITSNLQYFLLVFSKKHPFGGMDLDFWLHDSLNACCKNSHKIEDNLLCAVLYAESTIKAKMLNFTVAFSKITTSVNVKALSAKENLNHQPIAKIFRFPNGILNTLHILRIFVGNVSYFPLLFHV